MWIHSRFGLMKLNRLSMHSRSCSKAIRRIGTWACLFNKTPTSGSGPRTWNTNSAMSAIRTSISLSTTAGFRYMRLLAPSYCRVFSLTRRIGPARQSTTLRSSSVGRGPLYACGTVCRDFLGSFYRREMFSTDLRMGGSAHCRTIYPYQLFVSDQARYYSAQVTRTTAFCVLLSLVIRGCKWNAFFGPALHTCSCFTRIC